MVRRPSGAKRGRGNRMATVYISPKGSGNKSGSDWANAASITSLDSMIKKAGAGGEVLFAADKGNYAVSKQIDIWAHGADGAAITIKGVNSATGEAANAVIEGTRPATYAIGNASGNELFKFQAGSGHLTFQNFTINNTGTAFRAAGDVSDIAIEHVDANNVARFFEDYAGGANKTATISGLTIRDVSVEGFSKGVIRLQYDTHDVLIEDVHGDSQRQDGDEFAIGVHLLGSTHDVVIRRTVMENATDTTGGEYWNGDGFATEGSVHGVLFEDTVARGNTDAGYDLKSRDNTLVRALAEDNKRNYRVWTEATLIDSVGLDPHKRGGSGTQEQIWTASDAKVKIVNGYFADAGTSTVAFENNGVIETINTVVKVATGAKWLSGKAVAGLSTAEIGKVRATGSFSAGTLPTNSVPGHVAEPVMAAPVAKPVTPVTNAIPAADGWTSVTAKAGGKLIGTTGHDKFIFDASLKLGSTAISSFGQEDVLITKAALKDGNGDGVIKFGDTLDIGSGGSVAIAGVSALKLLGHTADGYAYARQDSSATLSSLESAGAVSPAHGVTPAWNTVSATAKSETLVGTQGHDKFVFDVSVKTGADTIAEFGNNDVLIVTKALADGNGDGIITPGKNKLLDLGSGSGTVKLGGLTDSLRLLGHIEDGYVYARANIRPTAAQEGKLGAADVLNGDAGDKKAGIFFFDTALGLDTGHDMITAFGAKDILVTTSALASVTAGQGGFVLEGGGSVAVSGVAGNAVTALEFDGDHVSAGVHYYVYSLEGSAAGLDSLIG